MLPVCPGNLLPPESVASSFSACDTGCSLLVSLHSWVRKHKVINGINAKEDVRETRTLHSFRVVQHPPHDAMSIYKEQLQDARLSPRVVLRKGDTTTKWVLTPTISTKIRHHSPFQI